MDAALPGIPVSSAGAPIPPQVPDFKLPADPILDSLAAGVATLEAVVQTKVDAQVYRVAIRGRAVELEIPAELVEGDRLEIRRDPRGDFAVRILPPSRTPAPLPTLPDPAAGGGGLTPPEQIVAFLRREGLQGDPRAATVAEALVRFGAPLDGETVRRLIDLVAREPVARRAPTLAAGAFLASRLMLPTPSLARSLASLALPGDGPAAVLARVAAGAPAGAFPTLTGAAPGISAESSPAAVPGMPPAGAPADIQNTESAPSAVGGAEGLSVVRPGSPRVGGWERTAGTGMSEAPPDLRRLAPLVPATVPMEAPIDAPIRTASIPPIPEADTSRSGVAPPSSPAPATPADSQGSDPPPVIRTLTALREFTASLLDGVESGASAHRLREDAVFFLERRSGELPTFLARDLRRELDAWVLRPLSAPRLLTPLRDFVRTLRDRGALVVEGSGTAVEIDRILDRLFVEGGRIFRRGPAVPPTPAEPASGPPSDFVPAEISDASERASRPPAERADVSSESTSPAAPDGPPAPSTGPGIPWVPALRAVLDALVTPLTSDADPAPLRAAVSRLLGPSPFHEIPALADAVSRALDSSAGLRLLDRLIGEIDRLLSGPHPPRTIAGHAAGSSGADPVEAILSRVRDLLSGGSADGDDVPADSSARLDALTRDELSILKARLSSLERETIRGGPITLPLPGADGLRELAGRAGAFRTASQTSLLHREGIVIFDLPVAVEGRVQSVPVRLIRRDADGGSGGRRGGGSGPADVRIDVALSGLGRVTTRLRLEGKRVKVDFRVRSEPVRELLRAGERELAESLRARGLDPTVAVGLRSPEDEADPVPLEAFLAGHGAVDLTA